MSSYTTLHIDFILTDSKPDNKHQVLELFAEQASRTEVLKKFKPEDLLEKLEAREALGSTGFGEGVAIPHCAIDGLSDFVLGMMIIHEGVDFEAIDGSPVRLLFLIIGPSEQRNRHIKILSAISKMVKTPGVADKLISMSDTGEIEQLLKQHLAIRSDKPSTEGFCMVQVYIQKESVFDDVLELISSEVEGSITVIETQNAGEYLHRLPLFSTYWTEGSSTFNRLIQTVVPKSHCNNLIRRINMIEDTYSDNPGILVTAQDLMYASGSIDF